MIRVACRNSHTWEVPDDQAGLPSQCPTCGLLIDVPLLGDAAAIDPDGTYKLDNTTDPKPNAHLSELTYVYHPGHTLSDGSDIDLRGPARPPAELRPTPDPTPAPRPADRPRYDPETGELLQPLELRDEAPPAAIKPHDLPVAKRIINYGNNAPDLDTSPHGWGIFVALCMPVNLIVQSVIFLSHVTLLIVAMVNTIIWVLVPFTLGLFAFLVGHYALVLDEMGPGERDELPRPLRNVNPYDDFIAPFLHMLSSLILCYAPVFYIALANAWATLHNANPLRPGLPMPLPYENWQILLPIWYLAGSIFFPAVFLTICTSGTITNLAPHRILRLMARIGPIYLSLTLFWILCSTIYFAGFAISTGSFLSLFASGTGGYWFVRSYIAWPILILGIYLVHAFCWLLGRQYRLKHTEFPWVAQFHTPTATAAVTRPVLHPTIAAADEKARARAESRRREIR